MIIKSNNSNVIQNIQKAIDTQLIESMYWIVDTKTVFVSGRKMLNEKEALKRGYTITDGLHNGGVLVLNKGDIEVGRFDNYGNTFIDDFLDIFVEYLKSRSLNVKNDGNDILVDGFKVCGFMKKPWHTILFSGAHISINANLEDIQAICEKPMVKVPKGLSEYGITTDDIEKLFYNFAEKYE